MLNQPVERKRCGSCERWTGERSPGEPGFVTVASETAVGVCNGGPWNASERRARSACGHWKCWPELLPRPEGS